MKTIANYHVIDPTNIGDLQSSPLNYFDFPGYEVSKVDIRTLGEAQAQDDNLSLFPHHTIVGGGGLMFDRFLNHFQRLQARKNGYQLILWGAGQQIYQVDRVVQFDYKPYLEKFDCVGVRDFGKEYDWVPCVTCMYEGFDRKYSIEHEFVVFSHKKFQIDIEQFPRKTNQSQNFEEIISFLASGETILTSSFHGAYWGTLLGRKVLAFPFTTKFFTLKYPVALYPVQKWRQAKRQLKLFGKTLYQRFDQTKFLCDTTNWRSHLADCQAYPNSLEECRDRNRWFHQKVLNLLDHHSKN
ncbi:MAG: polysaccharide pyruvyl transferase family protein [Cyanobacteria bacterium J06592_8]